MVVVRKLIPFFAILLGCFLPSCDITDVTCDITSIIDCKKGLPEHGVWYCEALEMELSFEPQRYSYVSINGEKMPCECRYEYGDNVATVAFLHNSYQSYDSEQVFFIFKCDSWDEGKMIATELIDKEIIENGFLFKGNQYTFVRVDKPQDEK